MRILLAAFLLGWAATAAAQPMQNPISSMGANPSAARAALGAPSVVVTDPGYGGVGDGQKGFFYASWANTGSSLSAYTLSATVSIASGSSTLTWSGNDTGASFQPEDVGKTIAVAGLTWGGGKITTTIRKYVSGQSVSTADTADTTLAAVASTQMIWPAFTTGYVGKSIWIDRAATDTGIVYPALQTYVPALTTINSVASPFAVTVAAALGSANGGANVTAQPTRIWWGTDNTAAIQTAAVAAVTSSPYGSRVFFPAGTYCAFGLAPHYPTTTGPGTSGQWEAMGMTQWIGGEGVDDCFTDAAGDPLLRHVIPQYSPPPPALAAGVFAPQHLLRLAGTPTPLTAVWGDSMCTDQIQPPQPAALSPVRAMLDAMQAQNPSKAFLTPVNRCIGGATWQWLDSLPNAFPQWYSTTTNSWESYVSSLTPPVYGATSASPDVTLLFNNGGNDSFLISDKSLNSVINKTQAWGTDAYGNPTDVILTTAAPESHVRAFAGANGGDYPYFQKAREFANGLQRSTARFRGFGLYDVATPGELALWGWSGQTSMLRHIPDHPAQAISAGTPAIIRDQARDFRADLVLTGASGSAIWGSGRALAVQLSPKRDNILQISTDANGYLTLQSNVWGGSCTATASITSGANALTVAGSTTANFTYNASSKLNFSGGEGFLGFPGTAPALSRGMQVLLGGTNYSKINGGTLRSTIADLFNSNNLLLADTPPTPIGSTAQNLTYGGCIFVPDDAAAQADIVVGGAGAGGSALTTRITGYTSAGAVSLKSAATTTLSAALQPIFIGHISQPLLSSSVQAATDTGANPVLQVSMTGDQVYVGYQRATDTMFQTVFRGRVIRYGGPFYPLIATSGGSGALTVQTKNVWVDRPVLTQATATAAMMYGNTLDGSFDTNTGGNGVNHLSAYFYAAVFQPTAKAQNFAASAPRFGAAASITPVTGFAAQVPQGVDSYQMTPAATLATGTLTLPANFPQGRRLNIASSQAVTSLTVSPNAGQSITGAPTTLAANAAVAFLYLGTTWYRQ